jgi:O-acetylhomoserine (thiol)-lyase
MPGSDRAFGFDTLQIHAGQRVDATTGARAQPIYQTAAYVFEDSQHAADLFDLNRFGNTYTRIVNPTNAAFEERVAMLEGGVGALATASGMSATAITMLTLVSGGDGVVSSQNLYGGTHNQFSLQLPRFGVDVRFVDPHDLDAVRAAIDDRTRVLYAETIGNPRIDVLDIAGWAQIAEDAGLPLVIDNTFATPYLCRPFEHGAHIVVHSATKFIGGHGTSIGGVIVDSGRYDWTRGLFPGVTQPSAGYRGMRFFETFGNFAVITKARVETMPSPLETSVSIATAVAAIPEAVASAPTPPSSIAMRSSKAALVGLTMRV